MGNTGQWYIDLPVVLAAALVAYGVVWRKGIKPAAQGVRRAWHQTTRIIDIGETVGKIHDEFRPNGGGSLKDVIDRIEKAQTSMRDEIREQTKRMDAQSERFDAHMLGAARRDEAMTDLRDTTITLVNDFSEHRLEDADSFGELRGAVNAARGVLDRVAETVEQRVPQSPSHEATPSQED